MTTKELGCMAIFGGKPAFAEKLHVGRPNLGRRQRLMERIEEVLDRRWFTNDGPLVKEFEQAVAELTGTRNCVAMCNGTIALEIMIRAAELTGEVIVPSFTFVATAHALQWQEIKPVFCDVDPRTHNIDPRRVEELITPRTTGIIGVHLWGRACDVEALQAVAARHGIALFFDASHALACSHEGRMIGGFGRAEVFSFHATKFCNTFEGGAVVTNDDELAKKMRLMRNFGFGGKDNVIYVGSNGKMSEVAAAMGLTSIESHEEFIAANRANYDHYRKRLERIPGLNLLRFDERERCNFHYVVVDVDAELAHLDRDQLVRILEAENVLARRYFYPGAHLMEPYRSFQPQAGLVLPETQRLARRLFQLPTGTAIDAGQVERICDVLEFACSHGESVRDALAASRC
jgi:dTDP-4-amino-4,6-dideoxygalactose transaminase